MNKWTYLIFLGFSLLIFSCETTVDLVAEGEETPIVYGFIDATVDTQFVKITKSFVTEGNAYTAALDPENSEYTDLLAYIIERDGNDSINSYLLNEKVVSEKDSGVFYYPVQTVYYTSEIEFTSSQYDHNFEISFYGSEKNVSSISNVIGPFEPNNSQALGDISFVSLFDVNGSSYQSKSMKIDQQKYAKRYEFTLRFFYIEMYTDGSQAEKHLDFKFQPWICEGLSGQEDFTFLIDGEEFYQGIENRLIAQDNEANVTRRVIGKLNYIFDFAGDDLNTFIELNKPATSFNAEQNPYTNIDNGIGVWSSRGQMIFYDKSLLVKSIQELAQGQYTGSYKFCSDDPGHSGLSFGCN